MNQDQIELEMEHSHWLVPSILIVRLHQHKEIEIYLTWLLVLHHELGIFRPMKINGF
jgi:hypothetical protein